MIKNNISFTGYDARKLDGFVMKSNHGNIANEMIDIGQKEGFNVYFMERQPESDTFEISKNKKQPAEERIGGWPQDLWNIIGKKLLTFENSTQSDAISEKFNLIYDKTQNEIRKNKNIPQYYQMLNTIVNMPRVDLPAGSGYLLADPQTGELIILPENFVISEYEKLSQTLKNTLQNTHIPGGNYYLAKNTSGKETALVGKNELDNFTPEQIKQMLGTENVIFIPQMDYHIDMFMRPLDKGRILLTDDKLTQQMLAKGFEKIDKTRIQLQKENKKQEALALKTPFILTGSYALELENIIKSNNFAQTDEVEKVLQNAGYEFILVPGRLYETRQSDLKNGVFLIQLFNFMNANVLPNKNGELVYITNKSNIDEEVFRITPEIEKQTGFSVEKSFIESLKPYIKEENIYFVSGDNNTMSENLQIYQGGIHCMCTEVPSED